MNITKASTLNFCHSMHANQPSGKLPTNDSFCLWYGP
jgi:hypothetical protein